MFKKRKSVILRNVTASFIYILYFDSLCLFDSNHTGGIYICLFISSVLFKRIYAVEDGLHSNGVK